jgi:hypothetical protein
MMCISQNLENKEQINSKRLNVSEKIFFLEDRKAGAYPKRMETYVK